MNMKLLSLAGVLLVSVGNISSLDYFVGRPSYWDLSDEGILDELRQIHALYALSDPSVEHKQQYLLLTLKILVTRNVLPYSQLAPNVAYVPEVGTNCINYGEVTVFVDVPAARITAVVPQNHCISLQCDLPQNNEKLHQIIYIITYSNFYNMVLSQLPNLGAKVLKSGYGVGPGPVGSLESHDSLKSVRLQGAWNQ